MTTLNEGKGGEQNHTLLGDGVGRSRSDTITLEKSFSVQDSFNVHSTYDPVALAKCLHWSQHHPVHQRVAGSIPGQGTCLGCSFNPLSACIGGNQLMSLSLALSLSKQSKHTLRWGLKKIFLIKKIWPSNSTFYLMTQYLPKERFGSTCLHFILNSPNLGKTQVLINKWMDKFWYFHTTEIKRNRLLIHSRTWKNSRSICWPKEGNHIHKGSKHLNGFHLYEIQKTQNLSEMT